MRGEQLIPGEPDNEDELKEMIDAPVGDRTSWKPRWPDVQGYFVPLGKAESGPRRHARHRDQLRPDAAACASRRPTSCARNKA